MAEIFLSYRRQDSQSATGRLADRLEAHFGAARVFRDHDSIVAGEDFAEAIRRAVEGSTVVLVIVGPDWLNAALPDGQRRLDDAGDFVRLEIEFALAAGVPIVPVLVEGAAMPPARALPSSLAAFARCQAMELSETRWRYDAQRLIQALQSRFAIEALGIGGPHEQAPDANPRWMHAAARFAVDLLDLATHPTRLILRRQTGQAIDHIRAFLFLLGAFTAGHAMLFVSFSVIPAEPRGAWDEVLHFAGLAAYGALLGVFIVTLLLIVLALAWRLAGTRVEFRQLSVVMAYIAGGLWIAVCLGAFMFGLGVEFTDERAFTDALGILLPPRGSLPTAAGWAHRIDRMQAHMAPTLSAGPATIGLMVASGVWFAAVCWLAVAWQAFSLSVGVSRWRALWATTIWLALLGGAGVAIAGLIR